MQTLQSRTFSSTFSGLLFACVTFLFLLCHTYGVFAQTDKTPSRGFHPAGSYALSDFETISTTNGNLMLHIPLASLPAGRGGLTHGLVLNYNSKLYDHYTAVAADPVSTQAPSVNQNLLKFSDEGRWTYSFGYDLQVIDRTSQYQSNDLPLCPNPAAYYRYKVKMRFPDGSLHEFRPAGAWNNQWQDWFSIRPDGLIENCGVAPQWTTAPLVYYSVDSTYLRLEFQHDSDQNPFNNPWTLYTPNGGRVTFNEPNTLGQRIYDQNNNYIEIQSQHNYILNGQPTGHEATVIVDQMGRSLVIEYNPVSGEDYIRIRGYNNQLLTWIVKWTDITIKKEYFTTPGGDPYPNHNASPFVEKIDQVVSVVDRIMLPSQAGPGLNYVFTYNITPNQAGQSYGWGELDSITLPEGVHSSGAKAIYKYALNGYNSIGNYLYALDILNNSPTQKDLVYWLEYDGSASQIPSPETWYYNLNPQSGLSTITEPDGGVIREEFNPSGSVSFWANGLINKTIQADGSVVERLWEQNVPYGLTPPLPSNGFHTGVNTYVKTEFRSIRHSPNDVTPALTAIKDY